jgi:WD40 repeat protein
MTAIFISHRSSDKIEADALKEWLGQHGHKQLFLDFDPADGIPAGVDWEQRLYRELRRCQALLIVLTPAWLESMWCRSELAIAREKGKAVFVVRVKPCPIGSVIPAIQEVDLTTDREAGLAKLARGLREHGLDPRDTFDWKPDRPIYPGLAAFDIDDAAIFFGRSEESWHVVEELRRLRIQAAGSPKLLLITGASGSGKSSLMKAGVLARLRKEPASWITARPFRCGASAVGALADALVWALPPNRRPTALEALTARLTGPEGAGQLLTFARKLRFVFNRPEATLVLGLDQAEELLAAERGDDAAKLLDLFRATLAVVSNEILVIATIRSDRLGAWQQHASVKAVNEHGDLPFEVRPIASMPMARIGDIVRGPAVYEGLRIDDDLIDAIRADTATPDALPLLAYTLQYLHRHFAHDGRLTLAQYRSFGGLEGSVRSQADAAIAIDKLNEADRSALKMAFVPGLVRATAEGGFNRSRALLTALPPRAVSYIQRLVDEARLLTTDTDPHGGVTVEIAHESLLRVWPTLTRWIADDAQSLRRLEAMQRAARDWAQAGRDEDFLAHRDQRLFDAEALVAVPHFSSALEDIDRAYLDNCRNAQNARDREARMARDRELARLTEAQIAQSRFLVERAEQAFTAGEPVHAALLGLASLPDPGSGIDRPVIHEAERITWYACQNIRERFVLSCENQEVRTTTFSPDGALVLTVTSDGLAALWDAKTGLLVNQIGGRNDRFTSAIFSPDGSGILTVNNNDTVCLRARNSLEVKYTRRFEGHIHTTLFSQDGGRLIILAGMSAIFANDKKSVDLWDARNGSAVATLEGHNKIVWSAAFSSDSRHLATASYDKTARLWDGRTGAALATLEGHRQDFRAVAFSPNGKVLATGSEDETVRLWNVATGKCLAVLRGAQAGMRGLSFSPDGRLIIATAGGNYLGFLGRKTPAWDVETGNELKALETTGTASCAEFSQDGMRLITVGQLVTEGQSHVQLWNAKTFRLVTALKGHTGTVYNAAFSADGRQLITASADGTARLWDVYSGAHHAVFPGHEHPIRRAVISPAGARLLTISSDAVRLWNLTDGSEVALLGKNTKAIRIPESRFHLGRLLPKRIRSWWKGCQNDHRVPKALAFLPSDQMGTAEFSPDGIHVVTASAGAQFEAVAWIWDARTGTKRVELRGHDSYVLSAAFSPDGARVATASMDGTGKLWDARTGALQWDLVGHGGAVVISAFSPDGKFVITSSVDKIARIWDVASGRQIAKLAGHLGIIFKFAFSPDGTRIVTTSDDYTARLWDASTGVEIANVSGRSPEPWSPDRFMFDSAFAFSSDSKLLVVGDSASPIGRVYCARSGRVVSELHGHVMRQDKVLGATLDASIMSVHFSPDDLQIITTSDDKTARIWDAKMGTPLTVLRGHVGNVTDAAFSDDGAHAVTTSQDGTVRLWKVASGEEIMVFRGHEASVSTVTFANDGSFFVTTSADGTARTWSPRWEWKTRDIVKTTKARTPRRLTLEERRRAYLDMPS